MRYRTSFKLIGIEYLVFCFPPISQYIDNCALMLISQNDKNRLAFRGLIYMWLSIIYVDYQVLYTKIKHKV